jgi:hypothetical protein
VLLLQRQLVLQERVRESHRGIAGGGGGGGGGAASRGACEGRAGARGGPDLHQHRLKAQRFQQGEHQRHLLEYGGVKCPKTKTKVINQSNVWSGRPHLTVVCITVLQYRQGEGRAPLTLTDREHTGDQLT